MLKLQNIQLKGDQVSLGVKLRYWMLMIYLSYLAFMVVSFEIFNYESLLKWFITRYPEAYSIEEYSVRFFTKNHYELVRKLLPVFLSILLLLIVNLIYKKEHLTKCLKALTTDISWVISIAKSSFYNLLTVQKLLLIISFVVIVGLKGYFFNMLPYQVDEAFNFIYFIKKGFLHTTLFTNNHPLYNFISAFWWILGMDPLFSSRITSIIASLVIHILIYAIIRRYLGFRTALFGLILTGITFWSNVFSVQGSAYMLMSLFTLISLIALFELINNSNKGYFLIIASSALGFYCSKLYIIPFISIVLLWVGASIFHIQWRTRIFQIIKATAVVSFLALLLYFPMYLWSGVDSVLHLKMEKHDLISKSPLLFESFSVMTEIINKSHFIILPLIVLSCWFFTKVNRPFKLLIGLNITSLISICLFVLTARLYPPSRALMFTNIIFYATIAVALASILKSFTMGGGILIACLAIITKLLGTVYVLNHGWQNVPASFQDADFYNRLNTIASCITTHQPNLVYIDNPDAYLNVYIKLAAIRQNLDLQITHDQLQLAHVDVYIADGQPLVDNNWERLTQKEFGLIFVKNSLRRERVKMTTSDF